MDEVFDGLVISERTETGDAYRLRTQRIDLAVVAHRPLVQGTKNLARFREKFLCIYFEVTVLVVLRKTFLRSSRK